MIPITHHKLGEKYVWLSNDYPTTTKIRVIRVSDGYFFNKVSKTFTQTLVTPVVDYEYSLTPVVGISNTFKTTFGDFPRTRLDLLFEVDVLGVKTYERHVYGGFEDTSTLSTCKIFGYLKTPENLPLRNVIIECHTLRDAYLKDYSNTTANLVVAVTDEEGYFELNVLVGLQVQINIPRTGFVTRGSVPDVTTLELSQNCLQRTV